MHTGTGFANEQMHTGTGSAPEAFCYFQEAKLCDYIFLKTCIVVCEIIQLLY